MSKPSEITILFLIRTLLVVNTTGANSSGQTKVHFRRNLRLFSEDIMCVGNKNLFHAMLPTTHILWSQNVLFTMVFWDPRKIFVGNDYFFLQCVYKSSWGNHLKLKFMGKLASYKSSGSNRLKLKFNGKLTALYKFRKQIDKYAFFISERLRFN